MASSTSSTTANPPRPSDIVNVRQKFGSFLKSLGGILLDVTALEVNTMVVNNISGSKFNPETAYEAIYDIPVVHPDGSYELEYFERKGIPADENITNPAEKGLRQRYLGIRKSLLQDYRRACHIVDPNNLDEPLSLPDPATEAEKIQEVLMDAKFLRCLRKLIELKAALDAGDPTSSRTDVIYAQTVIQLDGDVINRYHKRLFELQEQDKRMIIDLHHQGVNSGEEQWRGLLHFMVSLIQGILKPPGTSLPLSINEQKKSP